MLGGSAPSQTPGAPFRTESDNRAVVWPSSAHQSNIFNRGYGLYSLFPGTGENAKTLSLTSGAKITHTSSSFQEFDETQKVSNTFFPSRFSFGVNGSSQVSSVSHPRTEINTTELKLSPKTFSQDSTRYFTENKPAELNESLRKGSKRLLDDVVIIKSEIEELNEEQKIKSYLNLEKKSEHYCGESGERENIDKEKCVNLDIVSRVIKPTNITFDNALANEPDSTEFDISAETKNLNDFTNSEFHCSRKDFFNSENEVEDAFIDRQIENDVTKERCNMKVADLNADICVLGSKKKVEKLDVKLELINNDTCSTGKDKKCMKTKTSDISKTLSVNNKKLNNVNNELPKSSPTRMLSLPSQNGGCSRTTPVTFKQSMPQETYPKPSNLSIEVPQIAIKKEPVDFHKFISSASFLSPTPSDSYYSPGGLRIVDMPLLSPVPYPESLESSNKQKESLLSPNMNHSFLNSNSNFINPSLSAENPFSSSNVDIEEFKAYQNFRSLSKMPDHFLLNNNLQKMQEGIFLGNSGCLPDEMEGIIQKSKMVINSVQTENEPNDKRSENGSASTNLTPCQVAEVTSASALLSPKHSALVVKQEASIAAASALPPPPQPPDSRTTVGSVSTVQKKDAYVRMPGQSSTVSSTVSPTLLRPKRQQRLDEIKIPYNPPLESNVLTSGQSPISIDVPSAIGGAGYSGGIACDNRSANLITTWPTQTHNSTLWQYSAPVGYPSFPPVGFQLVRDPMTGHFLLIPASNIEALQRAVLWPSYQATPQMIIPPLTVQPSPPHLLLDTNASPVDFLTSDNIHHNNSQHRLLITTDVSKRKMTSPTVIKLEASDCSNTVVVTSCKNNVYSKTQSETLPLVNEPVFLNQRPSETVEGGRRSQATSPAPCLTSVLESTTNPGKSAEIPTKAFQLQTTTTVILQDASNQTDIPLEITKEILQIPADCKDKFEPYTRITEQNIKVPKTQDAATETVFFNEVEDDKQKTLKEIQKRKITQQSLNIHVSNVPDINIKKEIMSPSQVDLSGLELLSNSIEQFVSETKGKESEREEEASDSFFDGERKDLSNDACEGAVLLQNLKNGFREVDKNVPLENESSKTLGGLGLLCALAEQRFQEEIGKEFNKKESLEACIAETSEIKKEKEGEDKIKCKNVLKEECDINNGYSSGSFDWGSRHESDSNTVSTLDKEIDTLDETSNESSDSQKLTKTLQCKKIKFERIFSEYLVCESSSGKRGPGRPKKLENFKLSISEQIKPQNYNRISKEMSPPVLEKATDYLYIEDSDAFNDNNKLNSTADILKPPTLTPSTTIDPKCRNEADPCNGPLGCFITNSANNKLGNEAVKKKPGADSCEVTKRKLLDVSDGLSASKKRKVGRPKKNFLLHENPLTETIVAKKPKTKLNISLQSTAGNSVCSKAKDTESESSSLNAINEKCFKIDLERTSTENEDKRQKKIRPKLKAEPKMRDLTIVQEEENENWTKGVKKDECKHKPKTGKSSALHSIQQVESSESHVKVKFDLLSCVLTTEHLKCEKFPIRTLTVMGGLFYAGQLSAIRAPDVYGITIDGERGNRPHIYSREEILKDSILEIKPEKVADLSPGTRCCAYWSEQYRCLYPGTVSLPTSPDPELDEKFVSVEFDDGDSGRINIDDIRLLPVDYPIIEYDPNPLQSLSKRKRRISGTSVDSHSKEQKSTELILNSGKNEPIIEENSMIPEITNEETESKKIVQIYENSTFLSLENERRHLKKKRREKLKRLQSLSLEGKKKHKKHRCSEEHRHHRHHKKHRKHKHKHGRRHAEINGEVKREREKLVEGSYREKTDEEIKEKKRKIKCKSVDKSCKISDKNKAIKPKKCKERTESVESRSKIAAFLPARQLWGWSGKGYRRPGAKGRARKEFYKTIQRGKERITVGDCAVFLSTGRPDRPYIGRIESMWESWGTNMIVKVKWFYHPEETVGCPATLEYPGALFESPHVDENDVQTISHKCEVLPLKDYIAEIGNEPHRFETIYDNNDIYYLAGYYDPTNTTLKMEPGVK